MAILVDKLNERSYNPNARGAVTTIVQMRADNPFESERVLVTKPAVALRGQLAGLGWAMPAAMFQAAAAAQAAPAPAPAAGGKLAQFVAAAVKPAPAAAVQAVKAPVLAPVVKVEQNYIMWKGRRIDLQGLGAWNTNLIKNVVAAQPVQQNYVMWKGRRIDLQGLRGLGEGEAAPADSSGIDWAKLITTVGTGVASKLLPQPPAALAPRVVVTPAPGMSTTTKVLLVGGLVGAAVLAFVMLKKG